jgi:hypothetical protein
MRFEVLTTVKKSMLVFWVVMTYKSTQYYNPEDQHQHISITSDFLVKYRWGFRFSAKVLV